jgi:hypothetical protein
MLMSTRRRGAAKAPNTLVLCSVVATRGKELERIELMSFPPLFGTGLPGRRERRPDGLPRGSEHPLPCALPVDCHA